MHSDWGALTGIITRFATSPLGDQLGHLVWGRRFSCPLKKRRLAYSVVAP